MEPNFSEKVKKTVTAVTAKLINLLETNVVDQDKGREIASYILDEKQTITDEKTLQSFLDNLTTKYAWFADIAKIEKIETTSTSLDEQKLEALRNQLSQLANIPK